MPPTPTPPLRDRPADFIEFLRQRGYREVLAHDRGAIVRGRPERRQLALMFTGHQYAEGAEVILKTLADCGIQPGLFLTGSFLEQPAFEPLVRRRVRDRHYVGPHSDQHWSPTGSKAVTPPGRSRKPLP